MLGDHDLNSSAVGFSEHFRMRHTITPGDSQNALKAMNMEVFQELDVAPVSYPSFTALEEGGNADGSVDADLCAEILVLKDWSLPKVADACWIQLWTSLSMLLSSERILPSYLNNGTTGSCSSATVKAGGVGGMLVLHWQTTSMLVVLTVNPILLRHKSTVICILHLKDPFSIQCGGCLKPPDIEEVAI